MSRIPRRRRTGRLEDANLDLPRLKRFLSGLRRNNSKPWFDAHRDEFDALRAEFLELVEWVVLRIATFDPDVRYVTASECVYRIHRDVRFSKDKKPYKTNFAATIAPGGTNSGVPGYHVSLEDDGSVMVAGGLYLITPQQLERMRRAIDRDPKRLRAILKAPAFRRTFRELNQEDALRRPPRGYPADHAAADLLKLRRYAAWTFLAAGDLKGDLAGFVARHCRTLAPLIAYERQATK
jgi:uncharacterized protein (TIGR02453 family)